MTRVLDDADRDQLREENRMKHLRAVLFNQLLRAQIEPGDQFANALSWCEDYIVRELDGWSGQNVDRTVRTFLACRRRLARVR